MGHIIGEKVECFDEETRKPLTLTLLVSASAIPLVDRLNVF